MLLEPSMIVLYVDNIAISSGFYQDLLSILPEEASAKFHNFKLSTGMNLALKAKHAAVPPLQPHENGHGELVFILDTYQAVDELFENWQEKAMRMIFLPTQLPFGYTFVALDPDEHRLRVISLGKSS